MGNLLIIYPDDRVEEICDCQEIPCIHYPDGIQNATVISKNKLRKFFRKPENKTGENQEDGE